MADMEKVIKTLTDALSTKENYPWTRAEMSFEFIEMLLELLKEQDETINELKNAYGYLQKQFFEEQDKLLKEQEAVVRCKDCAYALFKEGVVQNGHIVCTKPFTERWQVVKPDNWFCGDWKRLE